MIIKKATALYFSPTYGTKKVVETFAKYLVGIETTLADNTLPEQRDKLYEFGADELVVVANPVYAGQMPQVQGLWRNLRGNDTPCIILACYGNRHYDDTLAQMQQILETRGFIVIGAAAPVIPHIFSPVLGAGRPDEKDEAELHIFAAEVLRKLAWNELESVELPGDAEPELKQPIAVPKNFNEAQCVQCGRCADLCPVGAIDGLSMAVDQKICISCMRCVKLCPTGARSFSAEPLRKRLEENFREPRDLDWFVEEDD